MHCGHIGRHTHETAGLRDTSRLQGADGHTHRGGHTTRLHTHSHAQPHPTPATRARTGTHPRTCAPPPNRTQTSGWLTDYARGHAYCRKVRYNAPGQATCVHALLPDDTRSTDWPFEPARPACSASLHPAPRTTLPMAPARRAPSASPRPRSLSPSPDRRCRPRRPAASPRRPSATPSHTPYSAPTHQAKPTATPRCTATAKAEQAEQAPKSNTAKHARSTPAPAPHPSKHPHHTPPSRCAPRRRSPRPSQRVEVQTMEARM